MLAQFLTETVLGALTGYITNDTAIRSLFQPGGVIEKTRDDFAHEAGKLLEDQVLTAAVLEEQLMLPEVQQALTDALRDFLQRDLPNAFYDTKIGDLPDYEVIVEHIQTVLIAFLQSEKETILFYLKKYMPLDEVFTEEQCNQFAKQLELLLLETMAQEQFAVRFWASWNTAKGNAFLAELGLADLCEAVIANLAKCSTDWTQTLQEQYGNQLRKAVEDSIANLQLDGLLSELDLQMEQYTLRQYLHCDADTLSHTLYDFLKSPQGQELLDAVIDSVLNALQQIHLPLGELLPNTVVNDIAPLLQQEFPMMLTEVVDWVWENKASVQRMLEESIDEIAAETGGMKGMLLQQLKESMLRELMESSSTYRTLLELFSDEKTTAQSVDWIMEKLTAELTTHTVGQLVYQLNQNKKLQKMLQKLLIENLERLLIQSDNNKIEKLLDWKPGALQLTTHKKEVEQILAQVLLYGLAHVDFPKLIAQSGDKLSHMSVQQLFPIDGTGFDRLLQKTVHQACSYASGALQQVSVESGLRPLYDWLMQWLEQNGSLQLAQESGKIKINTLVQPAADLAQSYTPQLAEMLSTVGLQMMQGRLSILAEEQIQSLSSEEMLELVEDFMGRELQPLNYLGAGMGAAAGATVGMALSTAIPTVSFANPVLALSVLAGKSAVFGAVGYTTNCAAVKGLFWPYEPVAGIRTIQGVIPKQKERFAGSMGRLVDRYVINDEILTQQIALLYSQFVQQNGGASLAHQDALFNSILAEVALRRNKIARHLCDAVLQYGMQSEDMLYHLGTMPLAFVKKYTPLKSPEDLHALYLQMLPIADQWLTAQLQKEIPLDKFVSAEQLWHWLKNTIIDIPLPDLTAMLQELLVSDRCIKELAGAQYSQIKVQIQQFGSQWLNNQRHQEMLISGIMELIDEEKLRNWISNSGSTWVQDNLTILFHWMESMILELLQNRQQELTAAVEHELFNRMNVMMQMGYAMMNGGEIVAAIVNRLLHQKLPIFLSVKRRELEAMLYRMWEQTLSPVMLELVKKDSMMRYDGMQVLLAQPVLHQCITEVCGSLLDVVASTPIRSWGSYVQLDGLLATVQMKLGFQWQTRQQDILACWKPLVQPFIAEQLHTMTVAELSRGYNGQISIQQLINHASVQESIEALLLRLGENLSVTKLQQWVDWDSMEKVLYQDITALLQDEHVRSWLGYEAALCILHLAEKPERILPYTTRESLIQRAVQAIFVTASNHGTVLLRQMHLSHLAEEQLKQMNSAHLELVVRGFAGHYLVHIQNRGWLGAIFALPGMLLYI